ncbi:MAG: serine hydrolase [Planctomycetota bacterium]
MRTRRTMAIGLLLPLALTTLPAVGQPASETPTLPQRLERLTERLEQSRQKFHIPGMAIAVVKDDQVILSRGFGLADVERGIPATDETLFAAGSTTKAFTATLVGMLVDDGQMSWDDPVRKHLPEYRLTDEEADEQVVIRDLLCHRVGFATMSLLWYGNEVGREDVLETALKAELLYPFREKFNYSNISYLAAGLASARTAGVDWDTLLSRRILEPLGMTGSNTSREAARTDARTAKGYKWERETGKLIHQPMRNVHAVAPAGAINASVRDMAQWVRFQLGRGTYEGKQLLSGEQHAETWKRHITVQGDIDYGLGWFLRQWRGRPVIEHAGGIDGFTAEVAMIPQENLGFVLLMNLFASPLQEGSREIVFDAMLGEWKDEQAPVAEDFGPYLGTYLGNFGPFMDAEFKVLQQAGNLAIDVPGQMVYELNPPDDQGRRQFAITDQVSVKFNRDDRGDVYSLTIYQAGYAFELPREGAEIPVEIDLDAARKYTGRYRSQELDTDVTVLIRDNRLAIDVPGQMAYELRPPDDEGRWIFRIKDTLWVRFNADDAGEVVSLTMSQEGKESQLPRQAAAETEKLPSADEIMAMVHEACGADHLPSVRNYRATGSVRMVHMGLEGTVTSLVEANGSFRDEIDLGKFGFIHLRLEEDAAWIDSSAIRDTDLHGEFLEQVRLQHPLVWLTDWRESFTDIHVAEKREFDGEPVYVVTFKPKLGQTNTLMVGAETGRPVAREASNLSPIGIRVPLTFRFADYRDVGGVQVPYRVEMKNPFSGRTVVEYEKVVANVQPKRGAERSSNDPCCEQSPPSTWASVLKALAKTAARWSD